MNITKLTASYRCKLIISALSRWIKRGESILDVGCGNGIVTKLLTDHFKIKIVGCDVKNYLIEKSIPFIKIKDGKLPLYKNRVNVVLLLDVLHHVSLREQVDLIQESLRVADKVIIFEAKPTITGKVTDIILNKCHYGDLNVPLSFRDNTEWKSLFRKLSLKHQTVILNKPFWYPFSHIAILLRKS